MIETTFNSLRQERARYYLNHEKARQEPQKYLSIIVDGMDQNKTDLPHLTRKNKSACNMWVLRTHVTGAIVHGQRSFAFIDTHLWPHDSNITINIFLHILLQVKDLPPVLYLQFQSFFLLAILEGWLVKTFFPLDKHKKHMGLTTAYSSLSLAISSF